MVDRKETDNTVQDSSGKVESLPGSQAGNPVAEAPAPGEFSEFKDHRMELPRGSLSIEQTKTVEERPDTCKDEWGKR